MKIALLALVAIGTLLAGALFVSERSLVINVKERPPLLGGVTPSPLPTRLPHPPKEVRAIYYTSWSAGSPERIAAAIDLIRRTELNGIVIDIKDFSGKVAFDTQNPAVKAIGSEEYRIADFPGLINRLHQEGIYVIARIAVFQDQFYITRRPDLAVRDRRTGAIWRDRKGLGWIDPAATEAWSYIAEVAKSAARFGVDEINFDYIRFPSDGDLAVMAFPVWKAAAEPRRAVIRALFQYLSRELAPFGVPLSVDLFGLSTVNRDDLGIGQVIEDAFPYFDYVAPMVYPSHYAPGFIGYTNPAQYPYEVIRYSLDRAVLRRKALIEALEAPSPATSTPNPSPQREIRIGRIRPWLQAFDLGARYTPEMVRKEIQAVYDAGLDAGWILWNPSNIYHPAALLPE